jgi:hypothetical protein
MPAEPLNVVKATENSQSRAPVSEFGETQQRTEDGASDL